MVNKKSALTLLDGQTDFARQILRGARAGHNLYVGPSEFLDCLELERHGFVHVWYTIGGFPAMRITSKGQKTIEKFDRRKAY